MNPNITLRESAFSAWRKGSFRGVPFLFTDGDGDLGRRNVIHEYPGRDLPYVEELGRKTRTWNLEILVAGPGYMTARNALIAALEEPGSGELVHPTLGTLTVAVTDARGPRESTRDGGTARFWVTFVESGEDRYPSYEASPAVKTVQLADAVDILMAEQLEKRLNPDGPGFIAQDAIHRVVTFADTLRRTIQRIPDLAASTDVMRGLLDLSTGSSTLIYAPADLYGAVSTVMADIRTAVENPLDAWSALRDFAGYAGGGDTIPETTASRIQQAENCAQLDLAFALAAATAGAKAASSADYDSQWAASAVLAEILDWLDDLAMHADPALYEALMDLRAGIFGDLGNRPGLPKILTLTLPEETPALVLAHRLYGDAGRDGDITTRNRIPHPGFVPSGTVLEVLDA